MRKDKKYAMIIFMEDERYNGKEYDCDFYASAPWVGNFLDIVYGNNVDELRGDGRYEGFYYVLYATENGKRISYGCIDFDSIDTEIWLYKEEKIKRMNTIWSKDDIVASLEECGIESSNTNIDKITTSEFVQNFHDRITELGNEMIAWQVSNVFKEKGE